ncbi:MAG: 8-oxo-dGTP diphosphatase [Sphaerochaeta sp.]|uniref:8-oxo-dGTP diphosphatase n=1 Tax=Sphaerochaeta sp. S2 TaxID=2798868 RepID=UPI0018E9CA32|nr:8-oxo-dGTP diphosphatase [Sphaerochaeta sp. S2]MBJ2357065.1 8-oxo-dGTP diphosphatase [Sphaerochaeta sp. S2]MDD4301916.1 8-oxo-dGTP diphosphatase [Sphaerochaeta sp.]MDD4646928.1 8-oxo-dGTP diphosphatase [Sphaerochaeta sp.]
MILQTIEQYYTWALIAILLLNLAQRKIPGTYKKRFATIYLASILLLFEVGVVVILSRDLNHNLGWLVAIICAGLLFLLRKRALPFRFHCVECDKRLDFNHIIGHDDNLCQECHYKAHPEEAKAEEEKKKELAQPEEAEEDTRYRDAASVADIDWDLWEPKEVCVITYLFNDDQVLLIDKKTGLGSGLVNAPGGHIEETETALEAAKREFTEETGLEVDDLRMVGKLNFQFRDGLSERGYVYFAYSFSGELQETDEARPFWCPVSEIPYDKMWEDDIHWLPLAMEGKRFEGSFIFDGQVMVDKLITTEEDDEEEL